MFINCEKKLEKLYKRKTAQNKTFTMKKFMNLKYGDEQSISKYLSEFQDLVNQLATLKITMDDQM